LPKENEPAAKRRKKGQAFTRRFTAGSTVLLRLREMAEIEKVILKKRITVRPLLH
jgi:hypothetical protein